MRIAGHLARKTNEDAMNFFLLFFNEANQFIVLFDCFQRLNVYGLSRRTGAVNDAGDAPF